MKKNKPTVEIPDIAIRYVIAQAGDLVRDYGHAAIDVEHILLTLLNQPGSINRAILRKLNVDVSAFRQRIQSMLADWHSCLKTLKKRPNI